MHGARLRRARSAPVFLWPESITNPQPPRALFQQGDARLDRVAFWPTRRRTGGNHQDEHTVGPARNEPRARSQRHVCLVPGSLYPYQISALHRSSRTCPSSLRTQRKTGRVAGDDRWVMNCPDIGSGLCAGSTRVKLSSGRANASGPFQASR